MEPINKKTLTLILYINVAQKAIIDEMKENSIFTRLENAIKTEKDIGKWDIDGFMCQCDDEESGYQYGFVFEGAESPGKTRALIKLLNKYSLDFCNEKLCVKFTTIYND